jgi:hypothetical protein
MTSLILRRRCRNRDNPPCVQILPKNLGEERDGANYIRHVFNISFLNVAMMAHYNICWYNLFLFRYIHISEKFDGSVVSAFRMSRKLSNVDQSLDG